MEELRIREKNIINIKIKDLTSYIKKNDETIIRLSAQDVTDFIPKQTFHLFVRIGDKYDSDLD